MVTLLNKNLKRLLAVNLLLVVAVCGYLYANFGLGWATGVGLVLCVPALILLPIWWSLANINEIPETMQEARQSAGFTNDTPKGTIASLWQLGSLASSGMDHYGSLSLLFNPVYLILAVLAILSIVVLAVIAIITGLVLVF